MKPRRRFRFERCREVEAVVMAVTERATATEEAKVEAEVEEDCNKEKGSVNQPCQREGAVLFYLPIRLFPTDVPAARHRHRVASICHGG